MLAESNEGIAIRINQTIESRFPSMLPLKIVFHFIVSSFFKPTYR